jgi:hypothetical protein
MRCASPKGTGCGNRARHCRACRSPSPTPRCPCGSGWRWGRSPLRAPSWADSGGRRCAQAVRRQRSAQRRFPNPRGRTRARRRETSRPRPPCPAEALPIRPHRCPSPSRRRPSRLRVRPPRPSCRRRIALRRSRARPLRTSRGRRRSTRAYAPCAACPSSSPRASRFHRSCSSYTSSIRTRPNDRCSSAAPSTARASGSPTVQPSRRSRPRASFSSRTGAARCCAPRTDAGGAG